MIVGVLKEPLSETRVSLLPEAVATLTKKAITVFVESEAGIKSSAANADYEKAGATILSRNEVVAQSEVLLSIQPPNP